MKARLRRDELLYGRRNDEMGVAAGGAVPVAEDPARDLMEVRRRAAERDGLAVGHDDLAGGFAEVDGAGPFRREVADARVRRS